MAINNMIRGGGEMKWNTEYKRKIERGGVFALGFLSWVF